MRQYLAFTQHKGNLHLVGYQFYHRYFPCLKNYSRSVIMQAWVIPSGTFTVKVSQSSQNILLTGTFEI